MALITSSRIVITIVVVALAVELLLFSPSSPPSGYLYPPTPSSLLPYPSNSKLQEVIKLGEGVLKKPEDVAFDKDGVMYAATRDGSVKRLGRNGRWENLWVSDSDQLLGITVTVTGDVIVCDAYEGLLKVSEEGVTVLASHVNGVKIRFADDVIATSDGTLYFSEASTKHSFHDWQLDVLETNPSGQLLKYDPSSNATSVVLEGLAFANGVAISADQRFLVVCETWKYRCLKYWLQGENKGQTETFIDNLPGRPDNINLASDSSFWIALLEVAPTWPKIVYTSPSLKYICGKFSKMLKIPMANVAKKAVVVNVGSDGKMMGGLDDPTGKVMRFVTSAVEFEGSLYFGSLFNDFVGKLSLPTPSQRTFKPLCCSLV